MTSRYLLTIDVGTSSTKTALWMESGRIVAQASQSYSLHRPDPLWAEIDVAVWWRAVCATTREVLAASGVAPGAIAGVGVDGVGWTLIPVDAAGRALAPAMIWLDRRAETETRWLKSLPDAATLVDLAANPIDAAYITPKLLWLRNYRPAIYEQTHHFLTASGYIVAALTGEFACDYTQAYGYHFFDMRRERWDAAAADQIGIDLEKMPRLCACTEVVGQVTNVAASETGIPAGTPVIAGCLDAAAGALGAGVTRLGQTNEQGGQAGGVAVSVDRVIVEPRLIFSHHVAPGQYLLQAGTVGGGSLGWFRDVLGQPEVLGAQLRGDSPFEWFSQQAAQSPPGANGLLFLPYMAGERTPLWNSHARGVFVGMSYATTRADLLRAIMEGCVFAVCDNVRIAEAHGVRIDEYLGSGGATASEVWCQIKADIYGKPFVVARRADGDEGGHLLGLFALTACGVGLRDDVATCVEGLLTQRRVYEPSPRRHAIYQDYFALYRDISRSLLDNFDRLAAVTRAHTGAPATP